MISVRLQVPPGSIVASEAGSASAAAAAEYIEVPPRPAWSLVSVIQPGNLPCPYADDNAYVET